MLLIRLLLVFTELFRLQIRLLLSLTSLSRRLSPFSWNDRSRFFDDLAGLGEVKYEELHVLRGQGCADAADDVLLVLPLGRVEVVEDHTRVAVFFADTRLDHLIKDFLAQILVVIGVDLRLLLALSWRRLLLSLLCLLLLFKSDLELFLSLLQELGCLLSDGQAALHTVVVELVKLHDAALVLLGEEVRD